MIILATIIYGANQQKTTSNITVNYSRPSYTVTFDPNGGQLSATGGLTSKQVKLGDSYGELPIPTRTNYSFLGWSKLTPNSYPEYILSNGTQYIDTGFVATGGMTAEYECVWTDWGGYIVGSHDPVAVANNYGRNCGYWSIRTEWEFGYGGAGMVNYTKKGSAGTRYHVKFCNVKGRDSYLEVNGERLYTITNNQNDVSLTNVYLLANEYAFLANQIPTRAKIYYVKIWDCHDNLVRDFVPYIDENSQVGMLDRVENKFYGNDGEGMFLTDEDILSSSNINTEIGDQKYFANWKHYDFLEYIEGTGTQYIDTNIHPPSTGMIFEYESIWTNNKGGYIVGSHNIEQPYGRNGGYWYGIRNGWELGYGETYPLVIGGSSGVKYKVKFSTLYDDAWLEVDGTRLISSSGQEISTNSLMIFYNQYGIAHDSPISATSAKVYYVKIIDSTNTHHIVPYMDRFGEVGMYDWFYNIFYGNSGTGSFIAGPAIS